MKKKMQSTSRSHQKEDKGQTKSTNRLRVFYLFMLVLTILSLVLRLGGARQGRIGQSNGETTTRVLTFHLDRGELCEDLVITAAGRAVFSDCGTGTEKLYALNGSERALLQAWVEQYSTVNYDHNNPGQTVSSKTQLYLDGRGNLQADEADLQKLIDFAETLVAKIASRS